MNGNGSGNGEWVTENLAGGHTNEEAESTLSPSSHCPQRHPLAKPNTDRVLPLTRRVLLVLILFTTDQCVGSRRSVKKR